MSNEKDTDSKADENNESMSLMDHAGEDSAAYNILRSKELIKALAQTSRQSTTVVEKARSFHELHKMLTESKLMSTRSKQLVNLQAGSRQRKAGELDEP